ATADTRPSILLPANRFGADRERLPLSFDPSTPEGLIAMQRRITRAREWGFSFLKIDYTTFDLFGKWGFEMGSSPTRTGWSFADCSRTNAEILLSVYRAIREAAGEDSLLLGCNTVGHLCAGIFDSQRTGDDTSGRSWERNCRNGVNTLAFRYAQHRSF